MIVRSVAERFANHGDLFECVQEQQGIEERIVWFAEGCLSEQVEQTVTREDCLLG